MALKAERLNLVTRRSKSSLKFVSETLSLERNDHMKLRLYNYLVKKKYSMSYTCRSVIAYSSSISTTIEEYSERGCQTEIFAASVHVRVRGKQLSAGSAQQGKKVTVRTNSNA